MKVQFFGFAACLALAGCGKKDDDKTTTTTTATSTKGTFTLKGGAGATSLASFLAATTTSPSYAKMTIYGFAVSTNEDCSSPITVFTSTTGKAADMSASPEFGSGELANGTYKCAIIEMQDLITFKPAASLTTCNSATEYQLNVCGAGSTTKYINGTTASCTSSAEKVAIYLSTMSTVSNPGSTSACQASTTACNPFTPPSNTDAGKLNGLKLASALTISGSASGTFNMDAVNKITDSTDQSGNASCDMAPPVFSFK